MMDNQDSFLSHLVELRDRLIRVLIALLIVFVPMARSRVRARPQGR